VTASRSKPPGSPSGRRRLLLRIVAVWAALAVVGTTAIWTDAFGVGDRWESVVKRIDRFLAGPVPDRSSVPTVVVDDPSPPPTDLPSTGTPAASPGPSSSSAPSSAPASSAPASPAPTPPPTAQPSPVRAPIDIQITHDPAASFAHQLTKDWCSPAAIQIVLALHGRGDTSDRQQREIAGRVREFESWADSHNGGWGPAAMSEALGAYGVAGYQIHAYRTRDQALRGAAIAILETDAPVILLAWRGAHTWVMSGFRADADPRVFPDARVTGTYILDPWYPSVSSIWGPSDAPGVFQDAAETVRNYLPWKRPEGAYPDRDGRFIALIPSRSLGGGKAAGSQLASEP
jgi:hypothetical protein